MLRIPQIKRDDPRSNLHAQSHHFTGTVRHTQENVIACAVRFHFIEALINMLVTKLRYDREARDTRSNKTRTAI